MSLCSSLFPLPSPTLSGGDGDVLLLCGLYGCLFGLFGLSYFFGSLFGLVRGLFLCSLVGLLVYLVYSLFLFLFYIFTFTFGLVCGLSFIFVTLLFSLFYVYVTLVLVVVYCCYGVYLCMYMLFIYFAFIRWFAVTFRSTFPIGFGAGLR